MSDNAGRPSLRKPVFNLGAKDKYIEQKHFEIKVMNIFLTKHHEITDEEKVPIIKNG